MKKATPVRLSLRKLMLAMLATGPIAILPSPLMAVVPTTLTTDQSTSITAPNTVIQIAGTGNLTNPDANTANLSVSDRSILVWTKGSFNIASGQAYNLNITSLNGSVLNRVGYNTNGTLQTTKDDISIAGNLTSNGRVIVLVNGNITVDGSARLDTQKGLLLSTIQDGDFNFQTQGVVANSGTALGNITIGNATASTTVVNGGLEAYAGAITLNRVAFSTSAAGDLVLRTVTANSGIDLGTTGAVAVTNGNISIVTNNGAITDTSAVTTNVLTANTAGSAGITLDNAANNFATIALNTSGGSATIVDTAGITIASSNLGTGGNFSVTTTSGNLATSGAVTANVVSLSAAGDITFANGSTVSGFSAASTSGNVSFAGGSSAVTFGALSGSSIALSAPSALTLNGTVATTGNISVTGTSITSTGTGVVPATANVLTLNATNGSINLAGSVTTNTLSAVATGSISQSGTGVITVGSGNAVSLASGSGGSISLTNNNVLTNANVTLTGGTASISTSTGVTIASANLTGGLTINTVNSTAGGGAVTLGSGSGTNSANIQVGGGLTISTNGSQIGDDDDLTIRVFGPLNLATATATTPNPAGQTGNITLDSAVGASGRGSSNFGQITANVGNLGNVTIHENQTVNLGTIIANVLTANSISGNVLFSGQVTANAVSANANTGGISQTGSLNITNSGQNSSFRSSNSSATILDNPSNQFASSNVNIVNGGNNIIVANSGFRLGNGTGTNNLTITTTATGAAGTVRLVQNNASTGIGGNNIVINSAGPIVVETTSAIRNLTLNSTDSTSTSITSASNGNLQVNGTLTLASAGNVSIIGNVTVGANGLPTAGTGNGANITGTVVLSNVVGNVALVNQRNLTLTGTANNVTATSGFGPFAGTWNLNLGNLNVSNLTANAAVAEAGSVNSSTFGSSGNVQQTTGSSLHVENTAQFISFNGGNIVLGNNGNSFGRIEAFTGGSIGSTTNNGGSISITEDATLKVGNIITAANATLTSRFGSVVEDTVASATAANLTVNGTLNVNALNGSILLGGTTNGGNTTGAVSAFNVSAPSGAVALQSSGNVTLGATAANSLSVRGNNIGQSGPLNIFGLSTFNATNSITLNDAANNFGPLALISGTVNQNISVTENGTLNLRSVTMIGGGNGTVTLNSVNGDIIDTGLGGVRAGGSISSTGTVSTGTGVVSLTAMNGNIVIDDATTDFPTTGGVAFNAKNVTLAVLGSGSTPATLNLGSNGTTSVATGNLIATSALGNIANTGNLSVGGNALFQTGAGNIVLNQSGNKFGSIRFTGNQITIVESDDTVINTGSSAIGQASIQSGGNLTINNVGGGSVTFGNVVSLAASGSIKLPKLVQAVGTLSVNAPGTKDLGALSISGDLSGKTPFNGGSGNYIAPQP